MRNRKRRQQLVFGILCENGKKDWEGRSIARRSAGVRQPWHGCTQVITSPREESKHIIKLLGLPLLCVPPKSQWQVLITGERIN